MQWIQPVPKIAKPEFALISKYVAMNYGINLTEAKLNMVENRLARRLAMLRISTFKEYVEYIFGNTGNGELELLRDLLSTNLTYFYRESVHFEFLQEVFNQAKENQIFNIWSAACSSGDEAYTIASIAEEFSLSKSIQYNILGTDISARMVDTAREAQYNKAHIGSLPARLTLKHFTKIKDTPEVIWTPNDSLKRKVKFQQFNLIRDIPRLNQTFDIIFCRNVLIYFKDDVKELVVSELIKRLNPGGYLLLGHSEGLLGRRDGLVNLKPTIFQKIKQ